MAEYMRGLGHVDAGRLQVLVLYSLQAPPFVVTCAAVSMKVQKIPANTQQTDQITIRIATYYQVWGHYKTTLFFLFIFMKIRYLRSIITSLNIKYVRVLSETFIIQNQKVNNLNLQVQKYYVYFAEHVTNLWIKTNYLT